MPRYLTAGVVALGIWVAAASSEILTGILPAAIVVALVAWDYGLWLERDRPWHDWTVIILLLPPIFAAVWIAVGGLVTDVERSEEARLLFEVGPGVALTGLLCTLISYHGRHHPAEDALEPPDRTSSPTGHGG